MEAQVMNGEFTVLKDTVWKLSSRVLLLEGFIKKQFGGVFWKFCEDQVNAVQSGSAGSESPHSAGDEDGSGSENISPTLATENKVLSMPPMIPIYANVVPNPPNTNSNITITNRNSPSNTAAVGAVIVNKCNKPIPPPPPLSCMKVNSSSVESNNSSGYQHKPRNFLPKSLAPKPKLLSTGGGSAGSSSSNSSSAGNNSAPKIELESVCVSDDVGAANSSDSSVDSIRFIKAEPQNQQRKSTNTIPLPRPNIRLSTGQPITVSKPSAAAIPLPRKPLVHSFRDLEVYKGGDSESDDDQDGYSAEGYLAAELVAATLSTPSEANKRMKYSFASSSASLNGTTPRQMRPNPCHTRCQNRCHDIWTDGDRMGVFETYWSIPSEEERRDWVAQRIERVDMATKRTEFSNFRTCTFKYYLPHPDNPWVQVCKNFFLATIDEKRSYIEKIAQSVKGETEKLSAKDIPFRRRNQMRGAGGIEYVGWMTGPGGEPVDPDNPEYAEGIEMDEVVG